jgi:hypothetical protein
MVSKLSKPGDVIVRLDTLCPATVFYADRRVVCSVPNVTVSGNYWISRKEALAKIKKGQLHWVVGGNTDVENFKNETGMNMKVVYSNQTESVGEFR